MADKLFVLAIPDFAPGDRDWMAGVRARFDPAVSIVAPHFTLVFPGHSVSTDTLVSHVLENVGYQSQFRVRLTAVEVLDSSHDGANYVSLIPTDDFNEILRLHDRLYSGLLEQYLRKDLPYKPHLTIGRFEMRADAARLVEELSNNEIDIMAKVTELTVAHLSAGELTVITRIPLGSPRGNG
ncbi:MAG: 2'-5' RNA ligase family protein [Chloroflexi bacterium]|nr:2'-5' RNA ligase family protein [Chloroflexota bacterium]